MIFCIIFTIQFIVLMSYDIHFLDWLLNDALVTNPLK
jgi:hypothetical protein